MDQVVVQPDWATRPVRVVFPARVCFSGVEFQIKEFTVNLSTGGIFLPTDQMVAQGTRGKLTFRVSRWEPPFTVEAEVARTVVPGEEANGQQAGLGIQFVDVSDSNQKKLERLISGVRDGSVAQSFRRALKEDGVNLTQELRHRPTDQKVMLAVSATGTEIVALIRDGNRSAVLRLLDNSQLASNHVQAILKDRRTGADFMMALKRLRRWMAEEPIRVLYCKHPATPLPDAVAQVKTLPLARLRTFAHDMSVRPQIRAVAQEIVKKKS